MLLHIFHFKIYPVSLCMYISTITLLMHCFVMISIHCTNNYSTPFYSTVLVWLLILLLHCLRKKLVESTQSSDHIVLLSLLTAGLLKYSFIFYHSLFVNWRIHGYLTYSDIFSRSIKIFIYSISSFVCELESTWLSDIYSDIFKKLFIL